MVVPKSVLTRPSMVSSANVSASSIVYRTNTFERALKSHITRRFIIMKRIIRVSHHAAPVLQVIKMNEDDATIPSRVFVKIMIQEVTEHGSTYTQGTLRG